MLRATINSVAGTAARKASRTALRPETISPLGFSIRLARAPAVGVRFSAAFFRLAAAWYGRSSALVVGP